MGQGESSPSDPFLVVRPDEQHEGPCNAWHYATKDNAIMKAFGHQNESTAVIINQLLQRLDPVTDPDWFKVGITGYWDANGKPDTSPRFGKAHDEVGRDVLLLGDTVAMRRYSTGTTFIFYPRPGHGLWSHSVASRQDFEKWLQLMNDE